MKTCSYIITLALSLALTSPLVRSAVLAGWDFNGLSSYGNSPFAATTANANLTVGGLTRGSGVTTSGTAAGGAWGGNGFDSTSLANAVSAGDFATLSLTAATGHALSISSIGAYNIRRSATGPTTGQWQYQVGTNEFATIGSPITWGDNTNASGNSHALIDLSGVSALQNVAAGTSITFRLVNWDASGSTGTWYLNNFQDGNDLIINGAIPEPSSALLGSLGLLALLRRRR